MGKKRCAFRDLLRDRAASPVHLAVGPQFCGATMPGSAPSPSRILRARRGGVRDAAEIGRCDKGRRRLGFEDRIEIWEGTIDPLPRRRAGLFYRPILRPTEGSFDGHSVSQRKIGAFAPARGGLGGKKKAPPPQGGRRALDEGENLDETSRLLEDAGGVNWDDSRPRRRSSRRPSPVAPISAGDSRCCGGGARTIIGEKSGESAAPPSMTSCVIGASQ